MTIISDRMSAIAFDRTFRQSLDTVFAAFSDPAKKAKWFTGPADGKVQEQALDCRSGGSEILDVRWASGTVSRFEARYHRVDDKERIVYSYDLFIDGALFSISLADVRFEAASDGGTVVHFAESTAYYNEADLDQMTDSRMHGTTALFDMLGMALENQAVVSTIDDCH